jgi:rod shape-determining protein MreC
MGPTSRAVHAVVDKPSSLVAGGLQGTSDFFTGLKQSPQLTAQNRDLKARIAFLEAEALKTAAESRELDELRALNSLPVHPGREKIYGDIIRFDPFELRMTISVGSNSGVKPRLAVMTPEGLAAIVETVEENVCQAVLITSPSIKLGASAVREGGRVDGIIAGDTPNTLLFEVVRNAPVEVGDKVETSGLSRILPGGLLIGEVIEVTDAPELGSRLIKVFPATKPALSQQVVILK